MLLLNEPDVCRLVNILYARSGQTIIVRLTCKCSISTHLSKRNLKLAEVFRKAERFQVVSHFQVVKRPVHET